MNSISLVAGCLILSLMAGLGCSQETRTYSATVPDQAPPARTYATSPESTSELLRDASQAVGARTAENPGVHFSVQSTGSVGGQADDTRSEGDISFPDKVQMVTRSYLSPEPVNTEVVVTDGMTFVRSAATDGVWKTGAPPSLPPDPQLITGYLDFARSSRNFGQETLAGGRKTYHVQVDVDMPLLAAGRIKNTSDPEQLKKFEAMKTSVVTVDFWIDTDDRLIYQMLVKSSNLQQGQVLEQDLRFSDWGESVEIVKPCEAC